MDPEWAPCETCHCADGNAGFERWQIGEQWKSRVCPRRLVTTESNAWLNLYSFYRSGHLLVAGGVIDQPAIYLNVMNAIATMVAEAK